MMEDVHSDVSGVLLVAFDAHALATSVRGGEGGGIVDTHDECITMGVGEVRRQCVGLRSIFTVGVTKSGPDNSTYRKKTYTRPPGGFAVVSQTKLERKSVPTLFWWREYVAACT